MGRLSKRRRLQLFLGRLTSSELPKSIKLTEIYDNMSDLWERSIAQLRSGIVTEWGATLVIAKEMLAFKNIVSGTDSRVATFIEVESSETFVGTFHTHPYEDSTTGVAFSGADIASAINNRENISLVQSGHKIFMLLRTEYTSRNVDAFNVELAFQAMVFNAMTLGKSFIDAVFLANRRLCQIYRLALYAGKIYNSLKGVYLP
ncbi:hypothetical protein FJZ31_27765 [Candidatus Poribacteria bacterium]|nr:hypothetical protein [Candidatus Poribacteria bacterium]